MSKNRKTYYVTMCVEETIEVSAVNEEHALRIADELFDPTAHAPVALEWWTEDDE